MRLWTVEEIGEFHRMAGVSERSRERIEKAEQELDPYDSEAWEKFWEIEIKRQKREMERSHPDKKMPWNEYSHNDQKRKK